MNLRREESQELGLLPQGPPTAYPTTGSLSQRRRSSAAHGRPSAPPPSAPIPNVPSSPPSRLTTAQPALSEDSDDDTVQLVYTNGRPVYANAYTRPIPSPSLSAVAAFSQATQARQGIPVPSTSHHQIASPYDDLSDPPPQSYLSSSSVETSSPPKTRRSEREAPPDNLLQPPTSDRPDRKSDRKPSSRSALTRALELAREAVQLDSTNDNPEAAVNAYAQSVALLSEVMDRVRRGEDSTEIRRRRRRSVAAQEDEIKRLQNIHDTYADRMNILSIIYGIPPVPYTSTSSADSAASNSPTTSASPSSDSSPHIPYANEHHRADAGPPDVLSTSESSNTHDANAIYLLDEQVLSRIANPHTTSVSHHPYAAQYESVQSTPGPRASTLLRRGRASSNLPPAPPPPSDSLPPAPANAEIRQDGHAQFPSRSDSTKRPGPIEVHRTPSNSQLVALREEIDDNGTYEVQFRERSSSMMDSTRFMKRDSPPLPPLPSVPAAPGSAPATPRGNSFTNIPASPRIPAVGGRARVSTQVSQPQAYPGTNGASSQNRPKSSAAPSTRSASPAESTTSAGSAPHTKSTSVSSVPPVSSAGVRSRSSSQSGRRPSIVGRGSPPPLPTNAITNGAMMRKSSFPTKQIPVLSNLQVDTPNGLHPSGGLLSPHLPTTPTSPLPPLPPTDPLLKPYHMMGLLRNTITSSTGGYITRRLHVPCEVWSQGGAKLSNVVEKVRVVSILCSALDDLQLFSAECFGAGNVNNGMALGIGTIGRKEAEGWLSKLDEFSNISDGVVANFGKKLGVGEGFVLKKTTWGDKLTRRFDKFTNGKNLDSPAAYVQGLKRLFAHAQLLDEHTRALLAQPLAPAYAAFPTDILVMVEQRLKRSSEFFATVVLTFVIRDLSQLLDKYAKKCEKWLAE